MMKSYLLGLILACCALSVSAMPINFAFDGDLLVQLAQSESVLILDILVLPPLMMANQRTLPLVMLHLSAMVTVN
ncbi:hypothetical protein [Psychromonas sp. MME2]|uniref:hypothetical protein n=1 Tax=Psychromonas sp. MME2 TaxID=3231033 RepID=UPI00339CC2AD